MEDLPVSLRLVVLFLLLGVNSFFAAAEVALVSVRSTRMRALAEGGDHRAPWVLDLLAAPDRMLSATQLGVTLASLGLGWAGESTVYRLTEPLFLPLIEAGFAPTAHLLSFLLAFGAIMFLHMVLGEVVPKNFAVERSERMALHVARPLELFARATGIFVTLVKGSAAGLSRIFGLKLKEQRDGYTADELKLVVAVSSSEGDHARSQQEMLHNVIDFYDLTLREVMVPRQEMTALPVDASFEQALDCVIRTRHSRIPVYEDSPEHVVGVCYVKELWRHVQRIRRARMLDLPPPPFRLRELTFEAIFVPETKLLHDFLEEAQRERRHLAMVVDEFGTVSGMITVEDALEQIVGEIRDEHEAPVQVSKLGEPVEVDGITNIRDLDNLFGVELPYDAGFETLAGFLLSRFGHIPTPGEAIDYESRRYTVVDTERNRIARVRIEPIDLPESSAS